MSSVNTLAHISTVIATVTLTGAFALSNQPLITLPITAVGILWPIARWKNWHWISHAGFIVFLSGVCIGSFLDVQAFVLLLAVSSTLAAWDLDNLHQRLTQTKNVQKRSSLIGDHLKRLLVVEVIGIGLGILSLIMTLQIRFGFILLLGLILIVGLSRAVSMVREVMFGEAVSVDLGEFVDADPLPLRHSFFQARVKNYLQKFKGESSDH